MRKRCSKCKLPKTSSEFWGNRSKKDGLATECKSCQRAFQQSEKGKATYKRYQQSTKGKAMYKRYAQSEQGKVTIGIKNKKYAQSEKGKANSKRVQKRYNARHPNRREARYAITCAVRISKLPRPDTLQCHYCTEQAIQYHHHKGYNPEYWLDVIAVCQKCHRKLHKKIA